MAEVVYHIPALLGPCIDGLNIKASGVYIDVTFGGGGHSRAILCHLDDKGHLYGFDQDEESIHNAPNDSRFTFVRGNFAYLKNFMRYYGVESVDGILADLGVSFHHFDDSERGFSFREDGPLDMRMNQSGGKTAAQFLSEMSEEEIADTLYLYGELKQARRIAHALATARRNAPIETTAQLVAIVRPLIRASQEKKELAQVFQAFRILVNHEIESLQLMLTQSLELLKPGGRLAVISYHSLEDRIVKNFMRSGNVAGKVEKDFYGRVTTPWKLINNKVITADDEEVSRNPRSRSAKLRIAEKL